MGFATHSLVFFGNTTLYCSSLGWHPWIQWLVAYQCWHYGPGLPTEFEQPCHYKRSAAVWMHIWSAHYDIPLNCQYDNIVLVAECSSTDFYQIQPPSMHYEQRSWA